MNVDIVTDIISRGIELTIIASMPAIGLGLLVKLRESFVSDHESSRRFGLLSSCSCLAGDFLPGLLVANLLLGSLGAEPQILKREARVF